MNRRIKVWDTYEYLYTNQELAPGIYSHDQDKRVVWHVSLMYKAGVIDKSEEVIIGDWIYTWENDK